MKSISSLLYVVSSSAGNAPCNLVSILFCCFSLSPSAPSIFSPALYFYSLPSPSVPSLPDNFAVTRVPRRHNFRVHLELITPCIFTVKLQIKWGWGGGVCCVLVFFLIFVLSSGSLNRRQQSGVIPHGCRITTSIWSRTNRRCSSESVSMYQFVLMSSCKVAHCANASGQLSAKSTVPAA